MAKTSAVHNEVLSTRSETKFVRLKVKGLEKKMDSRFTEMESKLSTIDAKFDKMDSKIEVVLAEVQRIGLRVEQQSTQNAIMLESQIELIKRQDNLEKEVREEVKTLTQLISMTRNQSTI